MEYLIIILVVGWLIYRFRKQSPQSLPSPSSSPETIDDVINRGVLYKNLNRHMEFLEVKTDTPLGFRMSRFLLFGADIARQAADIPTAPDEMDAGPESAAIFLLVQQGVHTLMTLEMGSDAVTTHRYKAECAKIIQYAIWKIFRYESRDATDQRGQRIFSLGHRATKLAQVENIELLQKIFDSWGFLLNELSDESVDRIGNVMQDALKWSQERLQPI